MTTLKSLGRPRPVNVGLGPEGVPASVGNVRVASVLEDWLVEDRWWTEQPLRRRYFELVLEDGRCVVVFRNLYGGRWFTQRG